MRIHVRLLSRLREHLPPEARGATTVDLPSGTTVDELLAHLGINGRIKLITVNGDREADGNRELYDGDCVRVFPIMVGG